MDFVQNRTLVRAHQKRNLGAGWIYYVLTIGAAVAFTAVPEAHARGPLLAERTAAQWGGPETRVRCSKMASMTGFKCRGLTCSRTTWKTCIGHALDLKQHRIVARMYGPDTITTADSQLKKIANACMASGLTVAGAPALIAAPAGDLSVEIIKTGIEACLKTQNLFSQIVAPGFAVTISETAFW